MWSCPCHAGSNNRGQSPRATRCFAQRPRDGAEAWRPSTSTLVGARRESSPLTHREIAKKGGAASRDGPALEHKLRATASRWRGLASNYQRPRASNAPERLPGHPKWSPGLPPGSILELWGSRSSQGTKNHQHRSYLGPISCPFGARVNHTIPNDCWTGMYRFYEDSEFGLHMASKG